MLNQNSEILKILSERKKTLEISIEAAKRDICDGEAERVKRMINLATMESSLKEIDDFLAANP